MLIDAIAFVVVFGLIILVHEIGHFVAARQAGVVVQEFGIGYPPRLKTLAVHDGVEYTLNAIPFGGFVKLLGEEDPDLPGSLASKSGWARVRVLAGGSLMNVLLATLLFTVTFLIGYQIQIGDVYVTDVAPGSPAEQAGILPGDDVVMVNGDEITSPGELAEAMQTTAGRVVELVIDRGGERLIVQVTPRVDPPAGEGAVGIGIGLREGYRVETVRYPLGKALASGIREVGEAVVATVMTFAGLIRGLVSPRNLAGPIGIFQITGVAARSGLVNLIYFVGFLNVNLFVVNLLPLPALDGGRILFVILEKIRGERVSQETEAKVHAVGLLVLLACMLVISYFDILRILQR